MPDIYNNEGHRNTGRPIYGHMREGNTRHGGTGLTLLPPPKRHIPRRATSNGEGGGCSGGLKGHRDRTGGLQGGARSGTHGGAGSLADLGNRAAMAFLSVLSILSSVHSV